MITISILWIIWSFFSLYKILKDEKNWDNDIYAYGVFFGIPLIVAIFLIAVVGYLP